MPRIAALATLSATAALSQGDPLPSWNDGPTNQAILHFVTAITSEGGPDYIAPGDRIATFDNAGTLWSEQPMYFQGMFVNDRIKAMAANHPEWASEILTRPCSTGTWPPRRGGREGHRRARRRHSRRDDQ